MFNRQSLARGFLFSLGGKGREMMHDISIRFFLLMKVLYFIRLFLFLLEQPESLDQCRV